MRLPIHLQREIARLHFYDTRQSHRMVATALGVAPNTVRNMRILLARAQRPWDQLQGLDDAAWRQALGNTDRSVAQRKHAPDWQWVHEQKQLPDATLEVIWRQWRESNPDGVGYSAFTEGYRAWVKSRHIVMRRSHAPGDKLFVDFAGRTVEVRDPQGGPSLFAQIFVAVLGHSNLTYVEAVASQTTPDWIACHIHCFEALGGVPNWVVSDNLKAAVWRRERDRTVLNPAYRDCLNHYDCAAVPARSRKPKDKSKAEVGVQIAQRWILFRLRERVFFSLEELNAALRELTEAMNRHPFKKLPGSRRQRFEEAERAALKQLPGVPYAPCDWRYGVRVGDDYHVERGGVHYSVPCHLRGKRVDLRFTIRVIEVMHGGQRVAMHEVSTSTGAVITAAEHRPVAHQRVLDGEPLALQRWASAVGAFTDKMIRHHLADRADLVNGLKAARRMRELARVHGEARFEEVCAYAWPLNITALRSVESILKQQADRQQAQLAAAKPLAAHENVRGPAYYGGNGGSGDAGRHDGGLCDASVHDAGVQ